MSVPEGWGECHIPARNTEAYRERHCDPNSTWRKQRQQRLQAKKPQEQHQPEQQQQDHFSIQEVDPEWKTHLMEDSGAD